MKYKVLNIFLSITFGFIEASVTVIKGSIPFCPISRSTELTDLLFRSTKFKKVTTSGVVVLRNYVEIYPKSP